MILEVMLEIRQPVIEIVEPMVVERNLTPQFATGESDRVNVDVGQPAHHRPPNFAERAGFDTLTIGADDVIGGQQPNDGSPGAYAIRRVQGRYDIGVEVGIVAEPDYNPAVCAIRGKVDVRKPDLTFQIVFQFVAEGVSRAPEP